MRLNDMPIEQPADDRPVVEIALALAAIGWHVFPVERGAKRPIGRLTPRGHLEATTDADVIRAWWAQAPDAGIAVAVLPSKLVVVDVDPRNGGHFELEALEAAHGALATDVEAFTGGGGRHLVFLAPTDIGKLPGTLGKGVDLKSDGYIVVEPSVHPSARRYAWEASSSPLDGCVPSPLPGWIADLARRGAAAAAPALVAAGAPAGRALAPAELEEIRAALAHIPALERETWLHVGMALHRDVGGAAAFELWTTWSKTCAEKFDAQDQMRVWRSFSRKPMGQAIQLGTLFDLAYRHGFARPKAPEIVALQPLDPRTAATTPEIVEGPTVAALAMPVQGLNELALWIFDACPTGHALLAQASALALACAAAGRRYVSEFGDPATAYFGLVAPTASQVRPALAAAETALIRAGLRRFVRSQRLSSAQQIYASFIRSPSILYAADDWGEQLAQARRQPSALLSVAHSVLAGRIHACADVALDNWAEIGMKRPEEMPRSHVPTLYAPALTLLAGIGEPQLRQVFRRQELGRGALDPMLFVPALSADAWVDRLARAPSELPVTAWHALRALAGADPGDATELQPSEIVLLERPTTIVVRFAADLAGAERRWMDHARTLPAQLRPLSWGARATMRRLAVAMAAFADPARPLVDDAMLGWCERFVRECLANTLEELQLLGEDDDARPDAAGYVLEFLTRRGAEGCTKSDLPKLCKPFRRLGPEEREQLLGQLLADDLITDIPGARGRGARLFARQFVVERPVDAATSVTPGTTGDRAVSGVPPDA